MEGGAPKGKNPFWGIFGEKKHIRLKKFESTGVADDSPVDSPLIQILFQKVKLNVAKEVHWWLAAPIVTVAPLSPLLLPRHPAGRALTFDWSVNSYRPQQ